MNSYLCLAVRFGFLGWWFHQVKFSTTGRLQSCLLTLIHFCLNPNSWSVHVIGHTCMLLRFPTNLRSKLIYTDRAFPKPDFLPWNKGKLIGQKPPLQPKHVWAIRTRLQLARRYRDLALFNLTIDNKLRGCDLQTNRKSQGIVRGNWLVSRKWFP